VATRPVLITPLEGAIMTTNFSTPTRTYKTVADLALADAAVEILNLKDEVRALKALAESRLEDVEIITDIAAKATTKALAWQEMANRTLDLLHRGVKPSFPEGLGLAAIKDANAKVTEPDTTTSDEPVIPW